MSYKILLVGSLVLLAIGLSIAVVDAQRPPGGRRAPAALAGTGFTYQGQLKNNGALVNGTCDFAFSLWDAASSGNQIGTNITQTIPVTSGLFTTQIDFGGNAFTGDARWLASSVRCPSGGGGYTALSPRQPLTPAPYALYGLNNWGLAGNSATNPSTNFLGTTDNVTVSLRVSSTTALRLLPNTAYADSPIIIGGYGGNLASGFADGSVIFGGSPLWGANVISGTDATYSTIGGGNNNAISGGNVWNSVIAGGASNKIVGPNSYWSAIGGGHFNTASGPYATVGGGFLNTASSDSSAVGGGYSNTVSNFNATVGGGAYNTASGYRATVGGGNSNHASGDTSTVGGGALNTASNQYATIGGGAYITASGYAATVPGGYYNNATMSYTLAAGNRAKANHQGSFVWADSTSADFASTGNDQFLIRANGGVGIGTTSPASTLDVNGTIRVGLLGFGSTLLCYDGINVISNCVSSVRYKRNIADLNLGLATVEQLRPVTFDWKRTGEHDLGFVAEEVDAVAPLLTTRNSAGEIEGVKYDRVTAVLVNAVQEQQRQIVELTRQNAMLKNQNTSLEARLTAVEQANRDPKGFQNPSGLGSWNAAVALVIGAVGVIAIERARKGGAR